MSIETSFEWDEDKSIQNLLKHGVSFDEAQYVFLDKDLVIAEDHTHSHLEARYFAVGLDRAGTGVLTVRFTWRGQIIRIFGAGYWRKGKVTYEEKNQIH